MHSATNSRGKGRSGQAMPRSWAGVPRQVGTTATVTAPAAQQGRAREGQIEEDPGRVHTGNEE